MILFWLFFALVVAIWAKSTGRSALLWFFISSILSPLVGSIFLLISIGIGGSELKTCEYCAEKIKKEAKICKHCGKDVFKKQTIEESELQKEKSENV